MRIIQFRENQKEIWNGFIVENCSESFLQSWEWGEFQKRVGRKAWRLGIYEVVLNNKNEIDKLQITKLIAVILIVKYDLPFGRSYFYCPRGPVANKLKIKNYESKIFNILFSEIKKIAKKEKSLFLRIDPPIEMNRELIMSLLKKVCLPDGRGISEIFKKSRSEIQPKNTLLLDLVKSEEELLNDMKHKPRYNIRLAGKNSCL